MRNRNAFIRQSQDLLRKSSSFIANHEHRRAGEVRLLQRLALMRRSCQYPYTLLLKADDAFYKFHPDERFAKQRSGGGSNYFWVEVADCLLSQQNGPCAKCFGRANDRAQIAG